MTCVTTQTVGSELVLSTLVWLVLQHKQLLWIVSYNIGMTCVTTQTVGLKCFLQHWYDLCYNTNSWSELFLTTLVWLVLQHKQLVLNCFLQHWYDLCYNTNSCFELFLATLVWLVLQHKQLLWIVSCNIGMTCVTTQTVGSEMFLATLVWLVLQHKQLVWIVSCNIGMTCVTTQTVALKCFLQHWYDLCYNTNSWFELFLTTLVWLVLQHKQLVWNVSYNIGMTCVTTQTVALNVSCNIGMTCVTTQTVGLNCFLQHWYDLCYNTNSWSEMFLATLVWLVLQHKQLLWTVSCNIGMTCVTTQTVALKCFLQHWYDLCYNTNSCFELFLATLVWLVLQHKQLLLWTNSCFLQMFLATLVWLVLQHKQLLWTVSCNIGMTCVTTQTVALKCFLQHWYDLCYNTNSCLFLNIGFLLWTLVWLVLQHKQLLWTVSCNIGMTCVTTQTVGLNCFLQHWYDLCYNTNSCFELFLNCFLQHWYDLCYNTNSWVWIVSCNNGMACVTT